jgi:hypothetical protein
MALVLQRPGLESHDNPLSPMAICDAFRSALSVVESGPILKKLLVRYFDQGVRFPTPKMYAELNTFLKDRGVLPMIRYGRTSKPVPGAGPAGARKSESGPGSGNAGTTGMDGATGAVNMPATLASGAVGTALAEGQDPFAMLQQLMLGIAARGVAIGRASTGAPPGMGAGLPGGAGFGHAPGGGFGALPSSLGSGDEEIVYPSLDGVGDGGANAGAFPAGALIGSLTRLQRGDFSTLAADVPAALAGVEAGTVSMPGGFEAMAGMQAVMPAQNVLHALKATSFAGQMGQMDTVTLDIVALLFDQIFGDSRIPTAMKALIGRLQIPMLKVAVMDKAFFSRKGHPARHMLDTLGELSVGLGEGFDTGSALYLRIEAILERVVDEFEDDLGVFDRTTTELQALIQDGDKTADQAAKKEARRIQDKERLEVARLFAQNEIKARARDRALPRAVLRFLATEWMKLLIIAYAKGGRESRAWHSLVETMDILVWTLTPKQSADERHRLVAVLPGLLKRLATGMDIIGTTQSARERFNSVLMRCHAKAIGGVDAATANVEAPLSTENAAAIRAQAHSDAASQPAPVGTPPPSTATGPDGMIVEEVSIALPAVELSEPEPTAPVAVQLREEMRPIAVPEVLPAVTVKNPFGDGNIQLEEVSFGDLPGFDAASGGAHSATGEETPLPEGDEWTELVHRFKEGDWVELREEGGGTAQARLSYVSPYRGTYLFTNRKGQKIGEFSMYDITSALRTGRMTVMQNVPLFDRAFSGLVGMLRKNAEAAA